MVCRVLTLISLLIATAAQAQTPQTYALQCTASCVASDGTTQPAGTTLNLVQWDGVSAWSPPAGMTAVLYAGQAIYQPAPAVPSQITRWQAYQTMLATPSQINAAPATVYTDMQTLVAATGGTMQLAWQTQQFVYRQGPFISFVAAQLHLSSALLDQMFIAAGGLPP